MNTGLVDANGTLQNIIVPPAAGVTYTPPFGWTMQQVNPWVLVGQNISVAQPAPSSD